MLEPFDPNEPFRVSRGKLPHWWQPGRTYFVTFRTADSVLTPVAKRWSARRRGWLLTTTGLSDRAPDSDLLARLSDSERDAYHRLFTAEFERYLDQGLGDCALRDPDLAELVAKSLRHFDGERYELADFVVMPNHVHVLLGLIGDSEIEAICRSWKKFTAGEVNRKIGRVGRFWQPESFDHIVRSSEQLEAFVRYIVANPRKAKLRPFEYLLGGGTASIRRYGRSPVNQTGDATEVWIPG